MSRQRSAFFPERVVERARRNVARFPWAAEAAAQIVTAAGPWGEFTDDELWALPFGNSITRSWMVWSDGHCPACGQGVPMYDWQADALQRLWKLRCPHCQELFPKNDFGAFYRSGLDEQGLFVSELADRGLLFNAEHPDPADPLHQFGVDDGEGYVEDGKRWRFIGAYLIYGQWKQAVLGGITRLAAAHVVSGDASFAHRAGVLLHRVAELYPTHDFATQGLVYEGPSGAGYVSIWHDACAETRELALAYDQVREALSRDKALAAFLAGKAAPARRTPAEVCGDIEAGLLRDVLNNSHKIASNYPTTEVTLTIIRTVLDRRGDAAEIERLLDGLLTRSTAVEGVTGEKGLANYSTIGPRSLIALLGLFDRAEPGFLRGLLERYPALSQTWRFHVDTWCLGSYYPYSGDTGAFAVPTPVYLGAPLADIPLIDPHARPSRRVRPLQPGRAATVAPSDCSFLWQMHKLTGDPALAQVLYLANGNRVAGLPHDLFADDPEGLQRELAELVEREGPRPRVGSVNKQQWHLAILRSGKGPHERAAWLDYDSGGGHSHLDGMNLGLFAKGLDLLPDLGYPPVQYGGWESPRSHWYRTTASHNTVLVDGRAQVPADGETTLWAESEGFRVIRASCPEMIGGSQYERTVAVVGISPRDSYLLDIFRVTGGKEHSYFLHSHFATLQSHGLALQPSAPFLRDAQMRDYRCDPAPAPGWSVDWEIEDRYRLLPRGKQVRLRYTGLTTGAEVGTAESWVALWSFADEEEAWIPRLMVRRRGRRAPLASTFVGVLEPYEREPMVVTARRLPLQTASGRPCPDNHVAVEVQLADGRSDLLIFTDPAAERGPEAIVQPDWQVSLEGDTCLVRRDRRGRVRQRETLG